MSANAPQSLDIKSILCRRQPEVLTVEQVAEVLQVNPVTVRRLIWKGQLTRVPHIRHVRITQKALDRFLAD